MLCQFLLYSKVNQLYVYMYPRFLGFPSHLGHHRAEQSSSAIQQVLSSYFMCVCVSHSVMSVSLRPHGLQPTRLLCPQNFPGKNAAVGCHCLLQGIFPIFPALAGRFFTTVPPGEPSRGLVENLMLIMQLTFSAFHTLALTTQHFGPGESRSK